MFKTSLRIAGALCLGLIATVLIPPLALAGIDAPVSQSYPIEIGLALQAVAPVVVELIIAVLGLAGAYLLAKIHQYTGLKIDARHFDVLERIAKPAIEKELAKYSQLTWEVESEIAATVANRLLKEAKGAVAHHGLSKEQVQRFVLNRIPSDNPFSFNK